MNVLTINLLFMTAVFAIAAKLYIFPRLSETAPQTVLLPILILHAMRNLGLMFLDPGAIYPGMPAEFAYPAAFGDLLAAVLAVAAIIAIRSNANSAKFLVWIFNIEGSVDLLAAIVLANIFKVSAFMGPAYWIPAFWVPALLVTHYITFVVLIKHWRRTVGTSLA